MHTTADDPKKYRDAEEEQRWWKRDPLPRFRRYLESKRLWSDEQQQRLEAEVKERVDAAVKVMESFEATKPDAPFDHVFGTPHPSLEAQRAAFLQELGREGASGG
jgi:pyruvate dehydrogenase E1 component alpha subunit